MGSDLFMKAMKVTRKSMIKMLSLSATGFLLPDAILSKPFIPNSLLNNAVFSFNQEPLPYAYKALEPMIDGATMEIHYTKHAAAYCANLNKAINEHHIDASKGLETLLSDVSSYPVSIRNSGGGHYNHELFWKCMKPGGTVLQKNDLSHQLINTFGSFENFQKTFSEVATTRFGSGWAWLYVNDKGALVIDSTSNQDNPLMGISSIKGYPLLGLDVWEHAYYLHYQNRRAEYIKQWWKIVDWDFVSKRYEKLL